MRKVLSSLLVATLTLLGIPFAATALADGAEPHAVSDCSTSKTCFWGSTGFVTNDDYLPSVPGGQKLVELGSYIPDTHTWTYAFTRGYSAGDSASSIHNKHSTKRVTFFDGADGRGTCGWLDGGFGWSDLARAYKEPTTYDNQNHWDNAISSIYYPNQGAEC